MDCEIVAPQTEDNDRNVSAIVALLNKGEGEWHWDYEECSESYYHIYRMD